MVAEFVVYSKFLQVEQHLQLVDVVFGVRHAILPDMFGRALRICAVSKFMLTIHLSTINNLADWR